MLTIAPSYYQRCLSSAFLPFQCFSPETRLVFLLMRFQIIRITERQVALRVLCILALALAFVIFLLPRWISHAYFDIG